MKDETLTTILHALILECGVDRVEREVLKLREHISNSGSHDQKTAATKSRRTRARMTAVTFAENLDVSEETRRLLTQLAEKYDAYEFLPTISDIKEFCLNYDLNLNTKPSRRTAISRIFRHLSRIPSTELHDMIRSNLFSGPTRLGPISDAIRRRASDRHSRISTLHSPPTGRN